MARSNLPKPARKTEQKVVADLLTLGEEPARPPVLWGYARVSTAEQDPRAQVRLLVAAGVAEDRVVVEYASGVRQRRPRQDTLMRLARPGDTIVVWKLDRWGRSTQHLVRSIYGLGESGVGFKSLTDPIDTTTPHGRLILGLMASIAEFEASLIAERTNAGLERARAEGKQLGRPTKIKTEQLQAIYRYHSEGMSQRRIASSTGLSHAQVGRVLRQEMKSLKGRDMRTVEAEIAALGQLPIHGEVDVTSMAEAIAVPSTKEQ